MPAAELLQRDLRNQTCTHNACLHRPKIEMKNYISQINGTRGLTFFLLVLTMHLGHYVLIVVISRK